MTMSASSEFIALCRAQVSLLTDGLGASLSIVYLTEMVAQNPQTNLIPVVVYPETTGVWQAANAFNLLPEKTTGNNFPRLLGGKLSRKASTPPLSKRKRKETADTLLKPSTQIVLPLMHEGVWLGLLVTGREDRAWNAHERGEIDKIAQTLAIARVIDQRRAWSEQQLTQYQHLTRTQRDLLDNLLHQLRSPLTALRTFGKLLLKRFVPEDANRAVAENIIKQSDRLNELLQQLDRALEVVDVPSLPAVTSLPLLPPEQPQLCAITEVLEPIIASAQAIASEGNLELLIDIPPNLPPVKANPSALREVFSNLVDNALKYTPSGGKVYIQAGQKAHLQGITISNTGSSIPQEDLAHMFERHYRGVQAKSPIPGTGLGLAIAKDLVEQMQGKIEVFSPVTQPDGELGTTFIVWLPLVTPDVNSGNSQA